jgi:hypothetical protein
VWVCNLAFSRQKPWLQPPLALPVLDNVGVETTRAYLRTFRHIPESTELVTGPLDHVKINPPKHDCDPFNYSPGRSDRGQEAAKLASLFFSKCPVLAFMEPEGPQHMGFEWRCFEQIGRSHRPVFQSELCIF